jgi:Golgi phosphoprotein 3 GPP34
MGNLTLADDLLLLASSQIGTFRLGSPALEYGLAGALLIELALAERVTIRDGRVVVTRRPTGRRAPPRRRAGPHLG